MHLLDLIKNNTGWLVDSVESDDGGQYGRNEHDVVVACWQPEDIVVLHTLRGVVDIALGLGALLMGSRRLHERSLLGDWNWPIGRLCHARRCRRARTVSSLCHGKCRRLVLK